MPLSIFILSGESGRSVLLRREARTTAEAAGPPSAGALRVLRASRAVHSAEKALRAAAGTPDLLSLRSALEEAEQALQSALGRLSGDSERPA
jgi:hypothetical protein